MNNHGYTIGNKSPKNMNNTSTVKGEINKWFSFWSAVLNKIPCKKQGYANLATQPLIAVGYYHSKETQQLCVCVFR